MAKLYRNSVVSVLTYSEDCGYPSECREYRVHALGRGRWVVEEEDGRRFVLRTSSLQRFFRPRSYEAGTHSSGEPVYAYEEVQILKA